MTTTENLQDALSTVGAVYEDCFVDYNGVRNYLITQRDAEVTAMQGDGVTELALPEQTDEATRNWVDDGFDYLQEVYRDVFAGSVAMGLKETAASMKLAASALPPTATVAEKFGAYASVASEAAIGTAEDAARFLRGVTALSYGFMGVGVAHKAITEGWDSGAQEAFKSAGTIIGMEITLLSLAKAKIHPLLKVTYGAFIGSVWGLTFEDYYENVLSDIIQEAINEEWTQQQVEEAVQAASKDYVDAKLDEVGDFFDDILDGVEPLGDMLDDLSPENGWAPQNPGFVDDALVPWNIAPSTGSPLVLDLVGTGIDLTTFNAATTATFFDIDGDGFAEQTAWIGADMGLLARDLDENGTIDSVDELFGSPSIDGFALLATLDSNGDHVINQYDTDWSDLVVWVDDGDAITEGGELQTLASLNIVSFDLAGVAASTSTIDGNPISHTSTYRLANGTTRAIVDAWFVHDNVNGSYAEDYTLDYEALSLPTLRGFGELPALHIAMSQDAGLLTLVQDFVAAWDISRFEDGAALDADIEEILFTWAGVEGVSPTSRGPNVDARKLEFLEAFFGSDFLQHGIYANPFQDAGQQLEDSFTILFANLRAQLMLQAGAGDIFDGTGSYKVWSGDIEGDMDLSQAYIDDLEAAASQGGVDEEAFWIEVARFLDYSKGFENFTLTEDGWMDDAIYDTNPGLTWDGIKDYANTVISGSTLTGNASANTINGTAGNDDISGLGNNDILSGGDGEDAIYGGADNDTINGGNDADALYGDDGDDTVNGDEGSDTLYGGTGADILTGGAGGDRVFGENGNDVYLYTSEDDFYSELSSTGTDYIKLPSGITSGDISFAQVATGVSDGNLIIIVNGLGTIETPMFNTNGTLASNIIESIKFNDNSTFDFSTLTAFTTYGTGGNDNLYGAYFTLHLNDTIYGLNGNDTLRGQNGNDTLDGGDGNDLLKGGNGDDTYVASAGYDIIDWDDGGTDVLLLPTGYDSSDLTLVRPIGSTNDLEIVVAGLGQVRIQGQFSSGYGIETISFNGVSTLDLTKAQIETLGTLGNDTLNGLTTGASTNDIMDGRAGDDTLNGNAGDDTYYFSLGTDTIGETGGTDTIKIREDWTPSNISIYRAPNGSYATSLVLEDQNGNKLTNGYHFTVEGGTNNSDYRIEQIVFSDSTTWTLSSMEIETRGTSSGETIAGTSGGDASSADTIFGFGGADSLNGGAGDDMLDGGTGNDNLDGGSGNDTFVAGDGLDYIVDASGTDTLRIAGGITINDISMSNVGTFDTKITVSAGVSEIQVSNLRHGTTSNHVDFISFTDGFVTSLPDYATWTVGTSGNDTVSGNSSDNTLVGYTGNDTITGGDGNDDAHGGAGNDSLDGGNGNDLLYGGDGIDILTYASATAGVTVNLATLTAQNTTGAGTDTIAGFENLFGSAYNDTLTGDGNANTIQGGAGNDTLNGAGGTDTLTYAAAGAGITVNLATATGQNTGGAGTDTISNFENLTGSAFNDTLTGNGSANVIEGGSGNDTINGAGGTDTLTYANAGAGITMNLATATGQATGGAGTDTVSNFENLTGSAYNDTLTGNGSANVIEGGLGNDTIDGAGGTDTLTYANATAGITMNLATATGQNTGGAGTDTISNFENLTGSAFNDTLTGNGSANVIEGGAGNDTLNGAGGTDTLTYVNAAAAIAVSLATGSAQNTGGAGTDTVSNFENLTGSAFNDTLTGSTAANTINGGNGADAIYGGSGGDTLNGGDGNDVLYGEGGLDAMTGGTGADIYMFQAASAYSNIDTVSDFSTAQGDAINLVNLLAEYDPLTEAITDFVQFATSGANTTVSVDRDGTGTTYGFTQVATLMGVTGLTDEVALVTTGNLIAA